MSILTPRSLVSLPLLRRALPALLLLGLGVSLLTAQVPPDQAADMLLNSARRAFNEKNYPFAAQRFAEFLTKFGSHKEAPAARYGLALSLLEGPDKDYARAAENLAPLAGQKDLPDRPFVLYYLGLAQRGLGMKALAQIPAKPNEAAPLRAQAQARFDEAGKHFAGAAKEFAARVKDVDPAAKELPVDLEWSARARCDEAEMQLRCLRPKEAQAAAAGFVTEKALQKSRYRGLGLYYHGFAGFLLKDHAAAIRSLTQLAPYSDPVFGTHARYLVARVQHQEGERAEASTNYEGVLTDHAAQKKAAQEALRQPEKFRNDPEEKARLEALVKGPPPDHVARATFFLGVLQYEDGRFAEALARFTTFAQEQPNSPLEPEVQLRRGFCQVQLKQWVDAQKTLAPLAEKAPRLADQALLWLAKAQIGAADPNNAQTRDQQIKAGLDTLRRAAEKAGQLAAANPPDPEARVRRAEALAELADALQLVKQHKEAAATYGQLLAEKTLPQRAEEFLLSQATALHLAGDYNESDKLCNQFVTTYPRSTLLPAALFRHAENAYFLALAAEKNPNAAERIKESARLLDETVKRYQAVVEKYPEFPHVGLARYGLGLALYRKGELDKAREVLTAIPATDRQGELAVVPYQLADILIRLAPTETDDAISAGRAEELFKEATELLDGFVAAQPNSPQAPDALIKLGHVQQRIAALQAQPAEQAKTLARARQIYDTFGQKFPNHELRPLARFERAKVLALQKDMGNAVNELRAFTNDPLRNAAIAPMAVLHLATLLRGQNQAAEAANVLGACRQHHEQKLAADPTRAGWVPLLQYHHGVALREAGKRAEARAVFDLVVKQSPARPEAADAALRSGQCLKDDALQKIADANKQLGNPGLKPEQQAAAKKLLEEGVKELQDSIAYLEAQAGQLKQSQPMAPARARMHYEAAWGHRALAEREIVAARGKLQQEQWQKKRDELLKTLPPGRPVPQLALPEVPLSAIPLQASEKAARAQYQALIEAFPDVAVSADARFELAELLAERGEHDAAVQLLRETLDREPPADLTDRVRVRLGQCLLLKGDAQGALTQLDLVTRNPKSSAYAQAMYRAGECLLQLGDPAEAVKRLTIFRDQQPYQNLPGLSDRALLRLGHALAQQKQWDASRQAHEAVVARTPNSPWIADARYGIGWALQNANRFDEAVNQYTTVTQLTATRLGAQAQLNIGLCRLAQKRYPEATSALLVVPFTYDYPELNALAMLEAARALAENKQTDQAVRLLERVLRNHPDSEHATAAKKRLEELKNKG